MNSPFCEEFPDEIAPDVFMKNVFFDCDTHKEVQATVLAFQCGHAHCAECELNANMFPPGHTYYLTIAKCVVCSEPVAGWVYNYAQEEMCCSNRVCGDLLFKVAPTYNA